MRPPRQRRPSPRTIADRDADRLAARAAQGEPGAFGELCRGLLDDVWRYCWSLTGDRHLADEATQETFARATTAIAHYRGDAPARLWLIVLARRSVGATIAAERRAPVPAEPTQVAVADRSTAVELDELLEQLPADMREAFVLTQVLSFSYADTATALDCPVGTIRSRVFRAREALVDAWSGAQTRTPRKEASE
jgi:RNA polymerase sigma-70 factor, ECF subfamily